MKYSLLVPYYKRYQQFNNTLVSFMHHYKDRTDYEVVVIEDVKNIKNIDEHQKLLRLLDKFGHKIDFMHLETNFENCVNPCVLFNYGAKRANGKYFVITNPECFHDVDILGGMDEEFDKTDFVYVMCGCLAVKTGKFINTYEEMDYREYMWYQHSIKSNRRLHFCTALTKNNYEKIGGFDEQYRHGRGYDDNDFRETIRHTGIPFSLRDDLLVLHIEHDRGYELSLKERNRLDDINAAYCRKKWAGK